MLDTRYYEGYEGEGEVKVWSEENGNEDGIVIWIGFFNTILEGCFSSEFQKNGIIECYFNQDGFYDEKWEMKYPHIVLEELKRFNEINKMPEIDDEITMLNQFFDYSKGKEFNEHINQAVEYITDSNFIVCLGIGQSGSMARYAARFFSNVGYYSQ